jgi:hypothetical protein
VYALIRSSRYTANIKLTTIQHKYIALYSEHRMFSTHTRALFLQWLFEPTQDPGLVFSFVIILHRRLDSLDGASARRKAAI